MAIKGAPGPSLLDELHAPKCGGEEYSTCRPVALQTPEGEQVVNVVRMDWCGGCGAADWGYV